MLVQGAPRGVERCGAGARMCANIGGVFQDPITRISLLNTPGGSTNIGF